MSEQWKTKAEDYLERIKEAAEGAAHCYCEPPLQDKRIYRSGTPYLITSHGLVRRIERAHSQGVGSSAIVEAIIRGVMSAWTNLELKQVETPNHFQSSPKTYLASKKSHYDVRERCGNEHNIQEVDLDLPDY